MEKNRIVNPSGKFGLLLLFWGTFNFNTFGFNNSLKNQFELDSLSSLEIQNSKFSVILEIGKSNFFNAFNKKFFEGYALFIPPYKGDGPNSYDQFGLPQFRLGKNIENMYESNIEGRLSYSVGFGLDYKLKRISKLLFKNNKNRFFSLKSDLKYSVLNYYFYYKSNFQNSQILIEQEYNEIDYLRNNYRFLNGNSIYLKNKYLDLPLKIQTIDFCPTIQFNFETSKQKGGFTFNLGPQMSLRVGDYRSYQLEKEEPRFAYGILVSSGVQIKKIGIKLKYTKFKFFSSTPFPFNKSNESKVFNNYSLSGDKEKYFESLNLTTEINF